MRVANPDEDSKKGFVVEHQGFRLVLWIVRVAFGHASVFAGRCEHVDFLCSVPLLLYGIRDLLKRSLLHFFSFAKHSILRDKSFR